jgi:hypothetical protein
VNTWVHKSFGRPKKATITWVIMADFFFQVLGLCEAVESGFAKLLCPTF